MGQQYHDLVCAMPGMLQYSIILGCSRAHWQMWQHIWQTVDDKCEQSLQSQVPEHANWAKFKQTHNQFHILANATTFHGLVGILHSLILVEIEC